MYYNRDALSYNLLRLALVEFLEPSEARKAFAKLAYTKYKHLPLYLEWAPDNTFTTPSRKNKAVEAEASEGKGVKEQVDKQPGEFSGNVNGMNKTNKEEIEDEDEDEDEPEPDTTLFVKNINFATTEEQLKTVSNLTLTFNISSVIR